MAISTRKEGDKVIIELGNGHAIALEKIIKDFNLAGEKEAIDFILSVVSEADGKPISNSKGSFLPSDKLKKQANA